MSHKTGTVVFIYLVSGFSFGFVFVFKGRIVTVLGFFVVVVEGDLSHLLLFLGFINAYKPERGN